MDTKTTRPRGKRRRVMVYLLRVVGVRWWRLLVMFQGNTKADDGCAMLDVVDNEN